MSSPFQILKYLSIKPQLKMILGANIMMINWQRKFRMQKKIYLKKWLIRILGMIVSREEMKKAF